MSITSLRYFLSPSPGFLSHLRYNRHNSISLLTVFCSNRRPFNPLRRRNSTSLVERREKEKAVMEEENKKVGFNKRRAEGRDKSDAKKVLPLKQRKLNPNTICYLQILGTGMDTQDTSPAVLLFFDKQRFIFNAGEGLQRFCTEHRIKLSKIDHIFLSRVCSETAGGLPGLLLTLAGMGDEGMSVNVWGPSDIKYLIDAMRSFIPKAAMVHTHSFGASPSPGGISLTSPIKFSEPIVLIDDEVVKISAILLQPNTYKAKSDVGDGRIQNSETALQKCQNNKLEDGLKPGDLSVVYVCELPEIKGTFHPKKAAALGLRPGPKYRELQLGNSVKSDRQDIMVHPSDVMDPSLPGPIVLIVDCPTLFHLQELSSLESLSNYDGEMSSNQTGETSKTVTCIVHLSPSSVVNTPDYYKWMNRFSGVRHIMAGHEMKNVEIPILKASSRISARLNYLCPQFFPASGFWSLPPLNGSTPGFQIPSETEPKLFESISAENLLKFQLRPYAQLGIDRSGVPSLNSKSGIIDELLSEIPEIVDAAKQVNQFWSDEGKCIKKDTASSLNKDAIIEEPWLNESVLPSCLRNISREDMEIVLLGTGSSQPSKYRNVSSIFINLFSKGSLLLDCGEGTLGQLKRRFGLEGADEAVRGLKCIWISHIHADHHTGLARILALRRDLLKEVPHEPLLVIGPMQLKRFLDAYQLLEDLDMEFLDCKHTTESSLEKFEQNNQSTESISSYENNQGIDSTLFAKGVRMQSYWNSPTNNNVVFPLIKKLKNALKDAGLEAMVSVPVVHCPHAYGVVIKAANRINAVGESIPGWKVVYSGDSRPCPALVKVSRGATVLIHEATFEDGLLQEAEDKNHSTTQEAIDVGNAAGVYRIILTHFSQRYPKIPVFGEAHMHKTCIAFDLMSVNLADLPVLPNVLPYLRVLFRNEMIVDESDDLELAALS